MSPPPLVQEFTGTPEPLNSALKHRPLKPCNPLHNVCPLNLVTLLTHWPLNIYIPPYNLSPLSPQNVAATVLKV